jgi:hypothetical protein
MSAWRASGLAVLVLACTASTAAAQPPRAAPPLRRIELSVGGGLFGGADLGSADANLRGNSLARDPFRLFGTESTVTRAAAIEARLGMALTRRYSVEGTFSFARPELRTSISADAEGAPALVVGERIDQYLVDAAVVVLLDELRIGSVVPVLAGGAGYVRQLHEGLTLIEEGYSVHVGGGLRQWFLTGGRGLLKAAGLRADARVVIVNGAIAADDRPRSHGAISGGLFVVF